MKKIKLCFVLLFVLSFALLVGCSKPIFTVTFDSNGGSDVAALEVAKKETATKPADPTKEGYDFVGWYIGEEEYAFSTPVVDNITLTAKWEAKEYTITFNANGGSAVAALKVKYNEKAAKPADPTKEGYSFLGWYNGETAYTFSESVKSDLTLTAKWEEKEYVVSFDADGGNDVASQTIKFNGKAEKPADPVKEGFKFLGWYNGDVAYTFEEAVTADVTLKAKWEEIKKYTVKFVVDGEVIATETVEEGKSATAPTAPKIEGKSFVKWEGTYTNVTSDVEIVGVYEVAKFSVDFKVDGKTVHTESVEYGKDATAPADPTKDGYKFVGWDKEFTNIKGYTVVNAKFEVLKYSIKFFNGNTELKELAIEDYTAEDTITLPTYEVKDYYFFGWYNNNSYDGDALTEIKAGTTGDIKLYALNVKADINGGAECWSTNFPSSHDAGKGIDEISNLPEMFEMDFFKYLKDNNLLKSDKLDSSMIADTWEKFSGLNPNHNGDPKRIWNDTSSNSSKAADGYVSLFLYDTIIVNDDFTVEDVQGGFLGTEPYKTKYFGLINHLSALHQYKVENNNYTSLGQSTPASRALLAFVIDGYFYGTQGAADGYFKALRNVIPGIDFSYKISGSGCEKVTYENKGLPTPVRDGYVFAGWCLDKEGTKPLATNKPTNLCTIYAKWEQLK